MQPFRLSSFVVLAALVAGCDTFSETPDDTDAVGPVAVDQCTETYSIPGPFGAIAQGTVDPSEATFGAVEAIGDEAGAPTVSPEPTQVHIGWPGADTSTSISFVWTTDKGTLSSVVQWGEGTDLSNTTEGVSFSYGGTTGARYRVHELKLCGRLKPGTQYSYRVGGEGHWSKTYAFTTPMAPGTFDTFTVAIAGDSRGSYEAWGAVLDKMASYSPDFYMFSGDMVDIGGNQEEWYAWWNASHDIFATTPLVPAHGNHELLATNYFAMFSLPNNEQWFSVNYANATIVSLNDTTALPTQEEFDQVSFMNDKFGASDAGWKMAMHHRPTYSTCTRHGSALNLREWWEPVFNNHNVDFVFSGHNHIYERSTSVKAGAEVPNGEGTVYFVSGGAGAELYPESEADWFNKVANPIEHYIIAEFTPDSVTFTTRDLADNVLDTVTVPRKP